jgi:hypothetical protein
VVREGYVLLIKHVMYRGRYAGRLSNKCAPICDAIFVPVTEYDIHAGADAYTTCFKCLEWLPDFSNTETIDTYVLFVASERRASERWATKHRALQGKQVKKKQTKGKQVKKGAKSRGK